MNIIDILDTKAETIPLNSDEHRIFRKANDDIAKLRRDVESKWAQWAKVKHIQEGGNNIKYFHLIANGKHQRKKLFQLEQEEGTIFGQDNLKTYISEYDKNLFGDPTPNHFGMIKSENNDIPQLSSEENRILTDNFTKKKVHAAIMQMEKNKAPGPDGFLAEFYQKFWDVIKLDLMAMFVALQRNELPLFHLNFGTIILLPKKENAAQIQQYRPIHLLNVSFKIFTKVGTNRVATVANTVVRPTQTTFMSGLHILEGVVVSTRNDS
jgi:hypothetical protein